MGCDGGTIPRRDELVRTKKKPEQKDKDAEREFRWLHCALSQQRLQEPIVMCGLGRLYSKQCIIEKLLDKDNIPDTIKHIKSLKDIKQLQLTPNPAYTEEDKVEGLLDVRHAPYICKLIGLEMTGKFRFIALWSCGCVMSERALKQITSKASNCPICQTPYDVEDVIVLNGSEEDVELMEAKMSMRNEKRKSEKKCKKDKKDKEKTVGTTKTSTTTTSKTHTNGEIAAPLEDQLPSTSKTKTNVAATTKTKTIALIKRPTSLKESLEDPDMKRIKQDFTVANDPKATDVYKSLFTTHQTQKDQQRAHWVTYNPFYN